MNPLTPARLEPRRGARTAMDPLNGRTAVVTGASSGFGKAIAAALVGAGATVIGVARGEANLERVRATLGDRFSSAAGDASDPRVAVKLIRTYRPSVVVLNAGARTPLQPIQDQTWEEFERNWQVDVRHVFEWVRESLRLPLAPGSQIAVVSSGAALKGSVLSGGYAGAKATIRFLARYGAEEADRSGLGLRFVSLLPQLTPLTPLGHSAVAAYAERAGLTPDEYVTRLHPALTPDLVGTTVLNALTSGESAHQELMVTGSGAQANPW